MIILHTGTNNLISNKDLSDIEDDIVELAKNINRNRIEVAGCVTFNTSWRLQTKHVYSTLKRRRNNRFHVVSTWNTCGLFVKK